MRRGKGLNGLWYPVNPAKFSNGLAKTGRARLPLNGQREEFSISSIRGKP